MDELLEQAELLQNLLVSEATGGSESEADFRQLRSVFLSDAGLARLVPDFVRTCRSLGQFWQFIKYKYGTYAERRDFIWEAFRPLIDRLEQGSVHPSDDQVSAVLEQYDAAHINAVWSKALDRRETDPEGAITAARTLLESVCKHILDELDAEYDDRADLPRLYKETARAGRRRRGSTRRPVDGGQAEASARGGDER